MKRPLPIVAVAALAALLALAAPALSVREWRPEPVDFEQAVDPGAVLGKASGERGMVSRPLRAPRRFNLVGMRWRGPEEPAIAVRSRRDGGRWSRWTPLHARADEGPDPGSPEAEARGFSTPTWAGEADWLQYRMSRRVAGLRLHYVNVKGTATAADRARTAVRRGLNTGVVAAGRVFNAGAQEPKPGIVPRSGWGAEDCKPRSAPDFGEVKLAFVHHTVGTNDYRPEDGPDVVLGVCRFHRNSNGWNDIGYNFLVDKYGVLYEGRAGGTDRPVVGAQAQGYNAQSTGIANLGTHTSVRQTPTALSAIARLIRWKLPLSGAPTAGSVVVQSAGGSSNRFPSGRDVRLPRVAGHRDANSTSCPGDALYAQLPDLRVMVGDLAAAGASTRLSASLAKSRLRFGRATTMSGRLRDAAGNGVDGRPIELQSLTRGSWKTFSRATTGGGGKFSARVKPHGNRRLRARFPGDATRRSSTSRRRKLTVLARVGILTPPRSARRARKVTLEGTVRPAKRHVFLVLQERRGRRNKTLGTRRVRARRGAWRTTFRPARRGAYRFYVVARADRATARGSSKAYSVRVR